MEENNNKKKKSNCATSYRYTPLGMDVCVYISHTLFFRSIDERKKVFCFFYLFPYSSATYLYTSVCVCVSAAFFYFAYRELRNPLYDAHNDHLHGDDIFATSTQVQSVESALCDVMYHSFFFLSMYISMNLDIFNLIYYLIHIQFNYVFFFF